METVINKPVGILVGDRLEGPKDPSSRLVLLDEQVMEFSSKIIGQHVNFSREEQRRFGVSGVTVDKYKAEMAPLLTEGGNNPRYGQPLTWGMQMNKDTFDETLLQEFIDAGEYENAANYLGKEFSSARYLGFRLMISAMSSDLKRHFAAPAEGDNYYVVLGLDPMEKVYGDYFPNRPLGITRVVSSLLGYGSHVRSIDEGYAGFIYPTRRVDTPTALAAYDLASTRITDARIKYVSRWYNEELLKKNAQEKLPRLDYMEFDPGIAYVAGKDPLIVEAIADALALN
jgi:hypothetical protein